LEVLLTIVLLAATFAALSQAVTSGLVSSAANENDLTAVHLAQEEMEELRNKSYASIASETKAPVPGFSAFQREVVVTIPQSNLKQVNVIVSWFSRASELNVTLVTYVSNV